MNYYVGRLLITKLEEKLEGKVKELEKITNDIDQLNDELSSVKAKMWVDSNIVTPMKKSVEELEKDIEEKSVDYLIWISK